MESCAKEAILPLAEGNVHILSWVRDIATKDAEYHCIIDSEVGRKSSKVFIRVTGSLNLGWSNELARWKSAVSEHSNIMEGWKKTWESCNKKDVN